VIFPRRRWARRAKQKSLEKRLEAIEVSLAGTISGLGGTRRALTVEVGDVQRKLEADEVLVEFIRYLHCLEPGKSELRYGAVIFARDADPHWVSLGTAEPIDRAVALGAEAVRGETDETTLRGILQELWQRVWQPVENQLLPTAKRLILSPDGPLCTVSFAVLLAADDRFVAEKWPLRYVASGRDLLRDITARHNGTVAIFADPDFDLAAGASKPLEVGSLAMRSTDLRQLREVAFRRLDGAARESVAVAAAAVRHGFKVQTFVGSEAAKSRLDELAAPHVLHFATHGFLLPANNGAFANPMRRSGLALAGANSTLAAWAHGEAPPSESDGLLTAEQVSSLDLGGTWLVTLWACETGLGEVAAGEGVMGLRRGFVQAGAQNLLMTLWPIDDQTTVDIMLDFYDRAFVSNNAPEAFSNVQRDWLVKLHKERGLLAAVRLAGAFIMSSQGRP
jgi:CHAT domain-containing protein